MKIWKFVLNRYEETVSIPQGAQLLSVQAQHGNVCLWALCDETAPPVQRRIVFVGTGHNANAAEGGTYVGTFQLNNGNLVFHVFALGEEG